MTEREQLDTLIAQNAELLAQNRQLMSMLQAGMQKPAPAPYPAIVRKQSKKEQKAAALMLWYHNLAKVQSPFLMNILQQNLKRKGLWLD